MDILGECMCDVLPQFGWPGGSWVAEGGDDDLGNVCEYAAGTAEQVDGKGELFVLGAADWIGEGLVALICAERGERDGREVGEGICGGVEDKCELCVEAVDGDPGGIGEGRVGEGGAPAECLD